MNDFDTQRRFDRVVSVEMFEHMRNYAQLFERISAWLATGGKFFMHIFVHRSVPYAFEDLGADDWMSRHFFSGGIMPSASLPRCFNSICACSTSGRGAASITRRPPMPGSPTSTRSARR